MKFYIKDRLYDAAAIQSITLEQVMEFDREAKARNFGFSFADLEELNARLTKMTEQERRGDPGVLLILSLTIWASRMAAGEKVSYSEAIDVPMSDLLFVRDEEDKKKPDPRRARPASGRAAKKRKRKASVSERSATSRKHADSQLPSTTA